MSRNLKTALVYASIALAIFVGFIAKIWLLGR
ncbi:MAG TPA: cytochrome oxidase small assembly protein [Burkholderiales bacterium]|nr:cytochrome oxidase small assembly protein [Burkholderiales bacterium]